MNEIKVSVVIAIYNAARYLRECLDSVVNQTLHEIEIICVNDGSTDHSLDIIKEYAKKDARIRIIDKPNGGYGHALNCGFDAARGEYVTTLDSDDYADTNMYKTLYDKAKETSVDIIKADYLYFHDKNQLRVSRRMPIVPSEIERNKVLVIEEHPQLLYSFSYEWSGIYKREFVEKYHIRHNETPGASYQDMGFFVRSMYQARTIYFLDAAFSYYRQDNPNASVKKKNNVYAVPFEIKLTEKLFNENPETRKYFGEYCYWKFNSYLSHMKVRLSREYWHEYLAAMREEFKKHEMNHEINYSYFENNKEFKMIMNNEIDQYISKIYVPVWLPHKIRWGIMSLRLKGLFHVLRLAAKNLFMVKIHVH